MSIYKKYVRDTLRVFGPITTRYTPPTNHVFVFYIVITPLDDIENSPAVFHKRKINFDILDTTD
jgi:hypothetical protein